MNPAESVAALTEQTGIVPRGAAVLVAQGMSDAFRLESDRGPLLLKVVAVERLDMLQAEAEGLALLASAEAVAVPAVIDCAPAGSTAYLAIEWIEMGGRTALAEDALGEALARQHRIVGASFGWHRDNYIGLTPQPNAPSRSWVDFWREQRLGFQLRLATARGLPAELRARVERLSDDLDAILGEHLPPPSLLHGDLWSGNWGATPRGRPYIFDPAVYYGDREADLAMTRLFGGFGPAFYESYERAWPLPHGWRHRVDLYNLYHLLNHYNLFGSGYLGQIDAALRRLSRVL